MTKHVPVFNHLQIRDNNNPLYVYVDMKVYNVCKILFFKCRTNLRITGLLSSDTGIFQCVASNAAGNIQASSSLKVYDIGWFPYYFLF